MPLYVTLNLTHLKKIFLYGLLFIFTSCRNNDTQIKEKDTKETQVLLSNNTDSLHKETSSPLSDSVNLLLLAKLVKHGMPILLSEAKLILGNQVQIDKPKHELDFEDYTWNLSNGITLRFEDINHNEKGVELDRLHVTSKKIIKHPYNVYLNKSTLDDCKKAFPNLKKAYDERTYKFEKNKTWYFLIFSQNNILIEINSSGWDTDMSS